MFAKSTQPTELETYDNALHTLIADRDKMVDRALRGIDVYQDAKVEIERQNNLVACCQLAFKHLLDKAAK